VFSCQNLIGYFLAHGWGKSVGNERELGLMNDRFRGETALVKVVEEPGDSEF